jgi:drug/metabolite transporter (DMT)-like permease
VATTSKPAKKHTAGAFDIRNFIGVLLGIFGVILLFMGLFADKEYAKTGNINANLWAGIVLVVVSAVFITWARLRPIIVPDEVETPAVDPTRPGPTRH